MVSSIMNLTNINSVTIVSKKYQYKFNKNIVPSLGKDQGQNVREKAKQLVNLLKDDDRLKNERARALKAKERFAQSSCGFGSDGGLDTPSSPKYPAFRGDWGSRESGMLYSVLILVL